MFNWPDNRYISRNYNPAEKQTPYFQDARRKLCRMDVFRDWEYPAALAAMGIDENKKYLCIGGFGDALAVFLSNYVPLEVIDRVSLVAIRDYPLSYGQYWSNHTIIHQGDWCEDANNFGMYDVIFSIGSVEHNENSRDELFMWQVGRHLNPGGIAVITTEWGERYAYDANLPPPKNVVGGHIYDVAAINERLVKPSGLTMTEWQENKIDWKSLEEEAPFIGRSIIQFAPALVILHA